MKYGSDCRLASQPIKLGVITLGCVSAQCVSTNVGQCATLTTGKLGSLLGLWSV